MDFCLDWSNNSTLVMHDLYVLRGFENISMKAF